MGKVPLTGLGCVDTLCKRNAAKGTPSDEQRYEGPETPTFVVS